MIDVSDKYKELMSSNRGTISSEIKLYSAAYGINQTVGQNDIVSIEYSNASCEDHIGVGSFVLPTLTVRLKAECEAVRLYTDRGLSMKGSQIRWNVLLKDETMQDAESAKVCLLTVKRVSPTADGEIVVITAESKLVGKIDTVYTPTITFPSNASHVIGDISTQLGYSFDTTRVSNFHIESIPSRVTYRDIIRSIAEYNGLFVNVNRDDNTIEFRWYGTVLHDPDYEIFKLSKDCCSEIQLTKVDEGYNGLVCATVSQVVSQGTAPFLTLENKCRLFDSYPQRVAEIKDRICDIKCRTGRVAMALGNILFDPWDVLKIEPDVRHNLVTCALASTTISGVSITRNVNGTYLLNGVATETIDLDLQSNDLPHGSLIMRQDIVDPDDATGEQLQWKIREYDDTSGGNERWIEYDSVFYIPSGIYEYDHYKIKLAIFEGASFNNVLIRPMITAADDDYPDYEIYQADQLFPVSQIDHQFDGGLRTTITIPEITQNDDGTVEYTGGDSEVEADIAAMQAQIASKADASTVTALAATVATKADAATVGAQIAQLTTDKANASDLAALAGVVATKADSSTVAALAATVATKADASDMTAGLDRITDTLGTEGSVNLFPIDKGVPGDPVIVEGIGGDFLVQQGNDRLPPWIAFDPTSDNSSREDYRTFYNWGYRFEDTNPWLFGDLPPGDYVISFDIFDDEGFTDVADFKFEVYESATTTAIYGDLIATCTGEDTEFTVTAAKPYITILAVAERHENESWVGNEIAVTPFLRRKAFETEECDIYKPSVAKQLAQIRKDIAVNYSTKTHPAATLPITITNAFAANAVDWVISGNSEGVGERTKNLLEITETSTTMANVTFTVDKTAGTVTATGRSSSTSLNSPQFNFNGSDRKPLSNGIVQDGYIFSCPNMIYGAQAGIAYYNEDERYISEQVCDSTTASRTISIPSNAVYYRFYVRKNYNAGDTDVIFKPMLRKSDTTADFIPYGYEVPLTVSQSGQTDKNYDIFIGDNPLTDGQSVSSMSTGQDIALFEGENTITTTLTNKPKMTIKHWEVT